VFNTRASAGHALLFNDRPELIAEYVDIPFIGKSDGVIEIVGASMNPTYVNGTRIAVRKLEDKQLIYPNECYYIIDANYDGRVKRLIKSEKEDHIILRSDNKEYPDVELHWNKIVSVCKILCRIIKS
jgi:phage repressor protein C with HTH and peptisase S24 domain